ncbi:MAG: SPOR domain-containing protein [Chromatiales bacterium]
MSRDYKHAANRKRRSVSGTAWLSFFSGLGVGMLVALLVYLQYSKLSSGIPVGASQAPSPLATTAPAAQPAPDQPEPEAAAPPRRPRFDFYTILPEMEVKVPEWQLGQGPQGQAPVLEPGAYVLQVASFQRFEEADKAKANLALQGISADIQRVVINGRDTWYRVRVGPFRDLDQVQAMRAKLQEVGMDFMLLKIKEG